MDGDPVRKSSNTPYLADGQSVSSARDILLKSHCFSEIYYRSCTFQSLQGAINEPNLLLKVSQKINKAQPKLSKMFVFSKLTLRPNMCHHTGFKEI